MRNYLLTIEMNNQLMLEDINNAKLFLTDFAKLLKLHVLKSTFHKFNPQGVTICLLLSESHICLHTWPEKNLLFIDIFSCSEEIIQLSMIEEHLGFLSQELKVIKFQEAFRLNKRQPILSLPHNNPRE